MNESQINPGQAKKNYDLFISCAMKNISISFAIEHFCCFAAPNDGFSSLEFGDITTFKFCQVSSSFFFNLPGSLQKLQDLMKLLRSGEFDEVGS